MLTPARRLAAVAIIAIVAVAAVIAVSASNGSQPSASEPVTALDGIPEAGGVLGAADAPITVTEFVDLQCPVCAAAAREVLPTVIDDYVRTGKVRLEAEILSFLGPDSVTAAEHAAGAREQGRLWTYMEAFFARQGAENSGYVTDDFLADVAEAAGVESRTGDLGDADAQAKRLGVEGTPTFVVDRGTGRPEIVGAADLLAALAR